MPWEEVETAKSGNRHELALSGKTFSARFASSGNKLDPAIFTLVKINFLDLSGCPDFKVVPDDLGKLSNLGTLIMAGNGLESFPGPALVKLTKLKVLNLSNNKLTSFPSEVCSLPQLSTINLSLNALTTMPDLAKASTQLAHVDLNGNQLTDMDFLVHEELKLLAEVNLSKNKVEEIPEGIAGLAALKKFDMSDNCLKAVPGTLADCIRIKDLALNGNPFADNRFKKLVAQKGAKAVLDYVRQHFVTAAGGGGGGGKKGKGKKGKKGAAAAKEEEDDVADLSDKLDVLHMRDGSPQIVVHESTKDVRPYIVTCIVRNVDLSGPKFKSFIQLQTRLHETVCERRNAATIATHDLDKIPEGDVHYTALDPDALEIVPLAGAKALKGSALVKHLRDEAEAYRKEKKRNTVSGVHQYLNLLKDKTEYACLRDSSDRVISFPPITNSDGSKISDATTSILVEVTSSTKLAVAKSVADALLKEMLVADLGKRGDDEGGRTLEVEQMKVVDSDGHLKVTYPSKTDLVFEQKGIVVKRP